MPFRSENQLIQSGETAETAFIRAKSMGLLKGKRSRENYGNIFQKRRGASATKCVKNVKGSSSWIFSAVEPAVQPLYFADTNAQ